ncbi:ankyrin repeat protein [Elusimicrobium simillimum]|uniref:ankyrin repeat domain-containing protein n=1 Tax=Elusimicrobium simillimum TaxID=3143438 RepID=UPI003C6FFDEB
MKKILLFTLISLLGAGALPAQNYVTEEQKDAFVDFLYDVKSCNIRNVKAAIDSGQPINMNTADQEYNPPLVIAIKNDCLDTAVLLYTNGARPNFPNRKDKISALNLVMERSRTGSSPDWTDMAVWFLEDNGLPNFTNKDGEHSLIIATKKGHPYYVKILLESGEVSLDKQDNNGMNALMWAAAVNDTEIMEMLLNAGASVKKRNIDGQTAMDIANYYRYTQAQNLLKKFTD